MQTEEDFADQLIAERRDELGAWIRNLPCLPLNTKMVAMDVIFDDGTEVEIDLHVTVEVAQPEPEAPSEPFPLPPPARRELQWDDVIVWVAVMAAFALGVIVEYAARTR